MVTTNGKEIVNAYTNGVEVKEIYSNGVKVWPNIPPLPEEYRRVACVYSTIPDHGFIRFILPEYYTINMDIDIVNNNNQLICTITGKLDITDELFNYVRNGYLTSTNISKTVNHSITTGRGKFKYTNIGYNLSWKGNTWRGVTYSIPPSEPYYLYLFEPYSAYEYNSDIKIYGVTVTDYDDNIVYKLIPAVETETSKAGFYDIISNRFISRATYNLDYDELP